MSLLVLKSSMSGVKKDAWENRVLMTKNDGVSYFSAQVVAIQLLISGRGPRCWRRLRLRCASFMKIWRSSFERLWWRSDGSLKYSESTVTKVTETSVNKRWRKGRYNPLIWVTITMRSQRPLGRFSSCIIIQERRGVFMPCFCRDTGRFS
jgi:hypothetical protein